MLTTKKFFNGISKDIKIERDSVNAQDSAIKALYSGETLKSDKTLVKFITRYEYMNYFMSDCNEFFQPSENASDETKKVLQACNARIKQRNMKEFNEMVRALNYCIKIQDFTTINEKCGNIATTESQQIALSSFGTRVRNNETISTRNTWNVLVNTLKNVLADSGKTIGKKSYIEYIEKELNQLPLVDTDMYYTLMSRSDDDVYKQVAINTEHTDKGDFLTNIYVKELLVSLGYKFTRKNPFNYKLDVKKLYTIKNLQKLIVCDLTIDELISFTKKAAEQPKAEQPKAEQPKAEQPKAEQPKAEQPKAKKKKAKKTNKTK